MNKNSFPKEETEIWGQKTLNNDFTLNERVSVRNLLLEIGDKVNNNLENIEFGKNDPNNLKDQAEKSVNSILKT